MNDIHDKIIQANGINQQQVSDQQLQGIQRLIKRENMWFLATKIVSGALWLASLILLGSYMAAVKFFVHGQSGAITDQFMKDTVDVLLVLETVLPLVIILAAVFSVFLYIRAKSLNLLQIHERLQNLEEMVKVLLPK